MPGPVPWHNLWRHGRGCEGMAEGKSIMALYYPSGLQFTWPASPASIGLSDGELGRDLPWVKVTWPACSSRSLTSLATALLLRPPDTESIKTARPLQLCFRKTFWTPSQYKPNVRTSSPCVSFFASLTDGDEYLAPYLGSCYSLIELFSHYTLIYYTFALVLLNPKRQTPAEIRPEKQVMKVFSSEQGRRMVFMTWNWSCTDNSRPLLKGLCIQIYLLPLKVRIPILLANQ